MHAPKTLPKQGRRGTVNPNDPRPTPFTRAYEKPETLIPSSGIGKPSSYPHDARKNKHNYHSNHQKTAISDHHYKMAGPVGFEPTTSGLGGLRAIHTALRAHAKTGVRLPTFKNNPGPPTQTIKEEPTPKNQEAGVPESGQRGET